MNKIDRLAAVIEAGGNGPEIARNVAHVLQKLDPAEEILSYTAPIRSPTTGM